MRPTQSSSTVSQAEAGTAVCHTTHPSYEEWRQPATTPLPFHHKPFRVQVSMPRSRDVRQPQRLQGPAADSEYFPCILRIERTSKEQEDGRKVGGKVGT